MSSLATLRRHLRTSMSTRLLIPLILFLLCLGYIYHSPLRLGLTPSYPPTTDFDTKPVYDTHTLALPPLNPIYAPYLPDLQLPTVFDAPLLRPLAARLHDLLSRPGLDLAEAQAVNKRRCPVEIGDNISDLRGEIPFWESLTRENIAERRVGVVKWLVGMIERGQEVVANGQSQSLQGRGIVLTGGNHDTTARLITMMRHLKRLNVQLPVEVFHFPGEMQDDDQRRELEGFGVTIREIVGLDKKMGLWKNFEIKGPALVQSSFREVLYLDSDNTPLRDPSYLFDAPLYTDHGRAVFWPDISKDHPSNAIWRVIGKPCSYRSWTFESGQMIIDKAGNRGLNLAALLIAQEMQREGHDFWFHLCSGDKDTFRWAFEMLDLEYEESPRWMSLLGTFNPFDNNKFCGHTVLQYDLVIEDGYERELPLFVHSNLLKHTGTLGLHRGNVFTHVKRMSDDSAHLQTLNHANQYVYEGPQRGLCTDMEWSNTVDQVPPEERERVRIETIPVEEIEGNVLAGFEDVWFDEGGRIGGW